MAASVPLEKRLSMNVEGNMLDIITEEICDGEWSLCVENCHGVRSVWFECFNSPDAALKEGQKAILEEGIDAFISLDGFEYLEGT
jgi:hypothetical protein